MIAPIELANASVILQNYILFFLCGENSKDLLFQQLLGV